MTFWTYSDQYFDKFLLSSYVFLLKNKFLSKKVAHEILEGIQRLLTQEKLVRDNYEYLCDSVTDYINNHWENIKSSLS